jgi:VanZ family protein
MALTLAVMLSPGSAVLAAKVWASSWLPFASQLQQASPHGHVDKLVHASLFALMGALATRGWAYDRSKWALVLLGVFGLAPLTELLQAWVPGRGSSWADGAADLLGMALGVGAALLTQRKLQVPNTGAAGHTTIEVNETTPTQIADIKTPCTVY